MTGNNRPGKTGQILGGASPGRLCKPVLAGPEKTDCSLSVGSALRRQWQTESEEG